MPESSVRTLHLALMLMGLLMPWQLCHAFTAITQNIAEFSDADPARIKSLLNNLAQQSPDVIFLQEAERVTVKSISTAFDTTEYKTIYKDTNGIPAGGLVIIAKRALLPTKPVYRTLPSEMDRGLLLTSVAVCDTEHTVVNLHLESPYLLFWKSNAMRQRQLRELKVALGKRDAFFVGGDFNFVFDDESEKEIPAGWKDSWTAIHPNEAGLTWDPRTNDRAMREGLYILPGFRLDRFLIRSGLVEAHQASLLGVKDREKLSDHFGLAVKLECSRALD